MTQIPAKLPAYGQETARWVLDAIKANPELHDQREWETQTECGTAMCVAGWVAFLHKDLLEDNLGTCVYASTAFEITGAQGLNLMSQDTMNLFYHSTNEQAVQALEYLAAGQPINWPRIKDGYDIS